MKKNSGYHQRGGRGWILGIIIGILTLLIMGLILVWANIERTNITYAMNIARNELNDRLSLQAKLEVERERLLSPYELKRKAQELGMSEPTPEQIRRIKGY